MATLDVLTYGFALNTDQGSFGYSTNSLLRVGSHNILIDTGPSSRRAFLYRALQARDLSPDDIDIIILTHMHWNQCSRNTHFQRNPSPSEGEPAQAPQGQGPQTSQDPNAERAESSHETSNHQEEGNFSQRNPENPRREARGPQAT